MKQQPAFCRVVCSLQPSFKGPQLLVTGRLVPLYARDGRVLLQGALERESVHHRLSVALFRLAQEKGNRKMPLLQLIGWRNTDVS